MTPPTDPLDDLLARPPHLDAPAFVERVLLALPRRRRSARPWVLGAGGVLASAVAAASIATEGNAIGPSIVAALGGAPAQAWGALLAAILLVATGCAVAAAELREGE
jgi:hypothetical protein